MKTVYLVTYDDGDYYCEGNHIVGIFSTSELAEEAIQRYKQRNQYFANYDYSKVIVVVDHSYEPNEV